MLFTWALEASPLSLLNYYIFLSCVQLCCHLLMPFKIQLLFERRNIEAYKKPRLNYEFQEFCFWTYENFIIHLLNYHRSAFLFFKLQKLTNHFAQLDFYAVPCLFMEAAKNYFLFYFARMCNLIRYVDSFKCLLTQQHQHIICHEPFCLFYFFKYCKVSIFLWLL